MTKLLPLQLINYHEKFKHQFKMCEKQNFKIFLVAV